MVNSRHIHGTFDEITSLFVIRGVRFRNGDLLSRAILLQI